MTVESEIEQLLLRARDGDRRAEERIFVCFSERFQVFTRHRIGDLQVVNDIVQDALAVILKKYKTEIFSVSFEAWAYGVLRMKIRNYYYDLREHREKPASESEARNMQIAGYSINPETEIQIGRCLKKIVAVKPLYARVLNLVYQGFETDEICTRLGISRNHLYVTLSRARAMLRSCLETGEV